MSKKLLLNTSLMLTLTGGIMVNSTLAPVVAVASAQAHLPAAPAAVAAVAVLPQAAPLTAAQMSAVQGAGLFGSIINIAKNLFKTVKKAIAGAIVSFFTSLFKSWIEQILGMGDGGQTQEKTQTETQNYASQADYDAGIVSTTATQETTWVITDSWGAGDCGGGGLEREGGMLYEQQMISAC